MCVCVYAGGGGGQGPLSAKFLKSMKFIMLIIVNICWHFNIY